MFATVRSTWICLEILQYNLRLIGVSIRRVIVTQLEQLIRSFPTIFPEMQKLRWRGRQTLERAVSTVLEGTMNIPPSFSKSSSNSCHFTHLFIFNYSAVWSVIRGKTANYHWVEFFDFHAQLFVLLSKVSRNFPLKSIFFSCQIQEVQLKWEQ